MSAAASRAKAGGSSSDRGLSIHARLMLLVMAASVPLLLFSAVLLVRSFNVSLALIESNAIGDVRRLSLAVDDQVGRAKAAMVALTQSRLLDQRDFAGFEDMAARALRANALAGSIVLIGRDGTKVAHTMRVPGEPLPPVQDVAGMQRLFATGQVQVSGLYVGQTSREWQVAVHVPVIRNGEVVYDALLGLSARSVADALQSQALPPGYVASVSDQMGQTIARTRNHEASVGHLISPGFRAVAAEGAEGYGRVDATRDNERVYAAFRRSTLTGWTTGLSVPDALVRGPRLQSFATLWGGGVLLLTVGSVLAWIMGRSIARPVYALAEQAARLGRNELPDPAPTRGVAEVAVAGRALHEAGTRLAVQNQERDAALVRAEASEARLETDVAARTRELAESEGRLRTYFSHTAEALFVVRVEPDGGFRYETVNPAHEELTGYPLDVIAERRPEEVLPPESAAAVVGRYRSVLSTGLPQRFEHTLRLTSRELILATVLMPVHSPEDGRITRIIGGVRDMTEQRRLELRLSQAQRMEAVGQLTGGVAHDFNNLLTVVIGNVSLLRRRVEGDARCERYLRGVEQAAERGARLTASLLAFSRRSALQVAPLDIGGLVEESAALMRRVLGEDVTLQIRIEPDLPPAQADAGQLDAAVLNLAINARDAIAQSLATTDRRGGVLRILVRLATLGPGELEGNDEARPGRFVAIEARDTGAGMTADVRSRAFEPFFTTKEIGTGTGLGLSQVYGFVRQLGGHVTLESTPGTGTAVTMYLPAAPADQPGGAAAHRPGACEMDGIAVPAREG